MDASDLPEADGDVESVTPSRLKDRIDDGEPVFLLDARSESDFEEWHIDGETVEVVNYPYYELLDGIPGDLDDRLPDDQQITALCAKGGASSLVAEHLETADYDAEHLADGMNGWARIYERVEITGGSGDTDTRVFQYRRPSSGCLAYLVVSGEEAAVIDPLRAFTDRYVEDARELGATIEFALDTHVHADHVSGVRELGRETGATAIVPDPAAERGIDYDQPYETVSDGDAVAIGDAKIAVIHTPGHTSGMTAYRVGDVLFTGDGLFTESVARPDLEDPEAAAAAARTLHETLTETVLDLPDETVVAPAHYSDAADQNEDGSYTATLGDLERSMDALSMDEAEFVEFIVSDVPPRPANYEEIIAANLGQESPDDERAFELELGPNNCAASEEALTN